MRALRFGYWWLAGGFMLLGFVLYTTLTPSGGGPSVVNDKLAHFIAFGVLMGWFSGVFRPALLPLLEICLAVFGVGIEFLQGQLPHRTAELADALFDFAGILVAWVLAAAGLGSWAEFFETRLLPGRNRSARDA